MLKLLGWFPSIPQQNKHVPLSQTSLELRSQQGETCKYRDKTDKPSNKETYRSNSDLPQNTNKRTTLTLQGEEREPTSRIQEDQSYSTQKSKKKSIPKNIAAKKL